jgi:4-hydroxybenzoate polyprenyltransferase
MHPSPLPGAQTAYCSLVVVAAVMRAAAEIRLGTAAKPSVRSLPLAVDLEHNLLKTNLLLEELLVLVKARPWYALILPLWLLRGKTFLRRQVARQVSLDVGTLPYREELLDDLRVERFQGRTLVLIAGDDLKIAHQVANHLNMFDLVAVASDTSACDRIEPKIVKRRKRLADYLRPLRLQHWFKNGLIFVPLLAAHRFDEVALLEKAALAFLSFGCLASSGYLINDLFDLPADRRHPTKRLRPFASGDLPLSYGMAMIPVLAAIGCIIGMKVSGLFLEIVWIYFALTLTYSLFLRKIALLDVIVLAGLYTTRILAGSAAVAIWPSHWLLAFSTFWFFSLALVKRYSELVVMRRLNGDHAKARGYENNDGELLAAMGIASGYLAVLVLALYISSDTARALYGRYELMWVLCPLLLYWISRVWLIAHRGKMPDDPVVFAMRDRTSRILMLLMLVFTVLAV